MMKMKLVKGFLFAIAGLFAMITLVSLIMPSTVVTTQSVVINADRSEIKAALLDFAQWKKWHPILIRDSSSLILSNPTYGVNASAEWVSTDKKTKLVITNIVAEAVMITLSQPGENPVKNALSIFPMQDSKELQVEWSAVTKLKWYPWEKFSGIFVSQLTGPGYEVALNNLKTYLEAGEANKEN